MRAAFAILPATLIAVLLVAGCSASGGSARPVLAVSGKPGMLPGISVEGEPLDARALAAESSFHFPDETRALIRGLMRSDFARREGQRLDIRVSAEEVERRLEESLENIRENLPAGQDLDAWARDRYGRTGSELTAAIRERLRQNQLYQLVLRAGAVEAGRYRISMLVAREEKTAEGWARRLQGGADLSLMLQESADPGPRRDGSYPPLPVYLPAPLGPALEGAAPGAVVGPFRFEGDRLWRVARLVEILPPGPVPPVPELLAGLGQDPVSGVEARAWFEEMVRRYTADERLPAIQAPTSAFVPAERF